MKEFNAAKLEQVEPGVLMMPADNLIERHYPASIRLDVHEDTIARAITIDGQSEPEYRGEDAKRSKNIDRLI